MIEDQRDLIDEVRRRWRGGGARTVQTWWDELSEDERQRVALELGDFVDDVEAAIGPLRAGDKGSIEAGEGE